MKKIIHFSLLSLLVITSCSMNLKNSENNDDKNSVNDNIKNYSIKTENVSYYPKSKKTIGYLAYPEKAGKNPGLILIHEWWGLNENIKKTAEKFAKIGYPSLAVDLYNGENTNEPEKAREFATKVRNSPDETMTHLMSAVNFLKNKEYVNSQKMASVGWCFGGGWSYQMAKNDLGLKASVIYYGNFNPEDDLKMMKTLIIGHFGEEDRSIKIDDVKQFQATLKTLSGEHEIYLYPNAGHGFSNPDNKNYVKESADLAWKRTVSFLEEHL